MLGEFGLFTHLIYLIVFGGLILAITGYFVARAIRNANAGSVRDDATTWQPSRARRGR